MSSRVLKPGEGPVAYVVGDEYTIKTSGAESGGAYSLMEAVVPPQGGPPPHRHSREDEAFYVLEGEVEFSADGQRTVAGPGSWISLAKGSLHYFKNIGQSPARMLILMVPAGLEQFFLEVSQEPGPSSPENPFGIDAAQIEKMLAAAPRYGLEIVKP
ncbi:cupin domain-containing protein [Halomonas sp. DP8Y7-1]|uniref:cupin domain-containing protein n=1 Tax=Halomonas sp. DP8Y7-1 TaxID=2859078 RepID=UPI001C951A1B|nr:cupin domain-containing protein [Halomonas sp. DP8Y7-1]MBY6028122.1 cupin domain-containing protein [Halomonas sp. DP8Y7-1]